MVAPKLVPGKCWKALNNARIHQDRTNRTRLLLQIEDYFKETIADHWYPLIMSHLCQMSFGLKVLAAANLRLGGIEDTMEIVTGRFWSAWAKAHEEKKLHDLWQIHRIYMLSYAISMLYLCYPQSQCLVFFRIDGPLDTIGASAFDDSFLLRVRRVCCR